jgi:hypothetical protein
MIEGVVGITAIAFEHTRVATARGHVRAYDQSFAAGEQLVRSFETAGLRYIFVLSEALKVNTTEFVSGLSSAMPAGVTVFGGFAADGGRTEETRVWCDAEACSVAAVAFYGDRLGVGVAAKGGWHPFGPERLVTKSAGSVVFELDGRPALDLYRQYLGDHADHLAASGHFFPLGLRAADDQDWSVRTLNALNVIDQSISVGGNVPEGSYVRLTSGGLENLVSGARAAAEASLGQLEPRAPELSVLVSCYGRRQVLRQRTEEEVEAVAKVLGGRTVLTGFYSYGEIAPITAGGRPILHNEAMAIASFAET